MGQSSKPWGSASHGWGGHSVRPVKQVVHVCLITPTVILHITTSLCSKHIQLVFMSLDVSMDESKWIEYTLLYTYTCRFFTMCVSDCVLYHMGDISHTEKNMIKCLIRKGNKQRKYMAGSEIELAVSWNSSQELYHLYPKSIKNSKLPWVWECWRSVSPCPPLLCVAPSPAGPGSSTLSCTHCWRWCRPGWSSSRSAAQWCSLRSSCHWSWKTRPYWRWS